MLQILRRWYVFQSYHFLLLSLIDITRKSRAYINAQMHTRNVTKNSNTNTGTQTRTCTPPSNGGNPCEGLSERECNTEACDDNRNEYEEYESVFSSMTFQNLLYVALAVSGLFGCFVMYRRSQSNGRGFDLLGEIENRNEMEDARSGGSGMLDGDDTPLTSRRSNNNEYDDDEYVVFEREAREF